MSKCVVQAKDVAQHRLSSRRVITGLRGLVIGAIEPMDAEEYRQDAMFKARQALGEIDDDGNELGDFCVFCTHWFSYAQCGENAIYCDDPACVIEAEAENKRD